jgi:hypothetical protein
VLLYKEEDLAVLQTASGLQGEEPLVDRRMYDKGNRQIGSVTSGKGLALVWVLYWAGGFCEVMACGGWGSSQMGLCLSWLLLCLLVMIYRTFTTNKNWYGQGESDCLIKT